ncbi:MAG: EF-hand domain-containing protein, partial [Verrucomicrobia bacterium]|nr:EF-hand domain-containing protein [Verrucomicrobiota bacterium]
MITPPVRFLRVAAILAAASAVGVAQERRPDGERGREGGREGGMVRMNPLFAALDANGDGVIDAAELANASVALKKLDRNGDGKITEDEVRPAFPGRGGQVPVNVDEVVARMLQFDKNGDGKLSQDELPERMLGMMERGDLNKDGFLTRDELV